MANIDRYLRKILEARFGEEVRGSIHDAISEINKENAVTMNKVDNMTVSASKLEPGQNPTVTIEDNGSRKSIHFGIPKGDLQIDDTSARPDRPWSGYKVAKEIRTLAKTANNLLTNSDFTLTNFIAQAGFNGAHGNTTYAGDRWISLANGTIDDGGITTQGSGMYQLIEHIDMSKVYTVAAWRADGSVAVCNGTFAESFGGMSSDGIYAGLTSSGRQPHVQFGWVDKKIRHVGLYEGEYTADTVPAYVPKGYAAEWMECQRYYRTVYRVFGGDIGNVSREAILLPIPMRVTPTVTTIDLWAGSTGAKCTVFAVTPKYVDVSYTGWGNVTLAISADL